MLDTAQVNRSLSTIRTELEYLRDAGVLSPPQLQSIIAQLPVSPLSNALGILRQVHGSGTHHKLLWRLLTAYDWDSDKAVFQANTSIPSTVGSPC